MPNTKECTDKKCPKHGNLTTRGKTLTGTIVSTKPKNTAIIQREYLHYIPKYKRYERRTSKINAHLPACMTAQTGDKVTIMETRKLSKTKSFVITYILK